jgi:hypothetical protein
MPCLKGYVSDNSLWPEIPYSPNFQVRGMGKCFINSALNMFFEATEIMAIRSVKSNTWFLCGNLNWVKRKQFNMLEGTQLKSMHFSVCNSI